MSMSENVGRPRSHHTTVGSLGHSFTTLAQRCAWTFGFESKEQMTMMADEACSQGSVDRAAFVRSLKTELRVALAKGNASTSCLHMSLGPKDCQSVAEVGYMSTNRGLRFWDLDTGSLRHVAAAVPQGL